MMNFIIVDSVKGGCGKSVEALAVGVRVSLGKDNLDVSKTHKVCIIDLDILGTSLEKMLLNDRENMNKKITTNLSVSVDMNEEAKLDVILSSPYEEDRRKFRISNDSNYSMQITPTHFRGVIKRILDKLNAQEYTTVIFDMPPNSDPYTDAVFDLVLSGSRDEELVNKVKLEIISNFDRAHVNANIDWLESICLGESHRRRFCDQIDFILNDSSCIYNIENGTNQIKTRAEDVAQAINEKMGRSDFHKRISVKYKEHNTNLASYFAYIKQGQTDKDKTTKGSGDDYVKIDLSGCAIGYLPIDA